MIKPLFDNVLIELIKPEEKTKSGIYVPTEDKKLEKAIVISKGPDAINDQISKDDVILLKSYSYDMVKVEDAEYCFVKEEEILGIL